ncbi:hypothetical protein ACHAXT_004028 [Thalassiosira profunda]
MNLRSSSNPRRMRLRQQKEEQRSGRSTPISPPASPRRPSSPAGATAVPKPQRPLTAYHIYFQIEREFIIQSNAGPDADKSIYANKSLIAGVPRRYRSTMLNADWYAGPGKRQKRKHRKSHGKIGFLELSRVISKRWATLDSADPETKRYVTRIANRELAEYKVELEEWKEATDLETGDAASEKSADAGGVSPEVAYPPLQHSEPMPPLPPPSGLDNAAASFDDEGQIDYSICHMSQNGHYLPSPGTAMELVDPLFELDDRRCVSPVLTDTSAHTLEDSFRTLH